jgi:hypothetical protein
MVVLRSHLIFEMAQFLGCLVIYIVEEKQIADIVFYAQIMHKTFIVERKAIPPWILIDEPFKTLSVASYLTTTQVYL